MEVPASHQGDVASGEEELAYIAGGAAHVEEADGEVDGEVRGDDGPVEGRELHGGLSAGDGLWYMFFLLGWRNLEWGFAFVMAEGMG